MTDDVTQDGARSEPARDAVLRKADTPPKPHAPPRALSPWSLLLGGAVLAALVLGQWVWVVAILGLAFLITVHEFGHFIAAKSFGMRVEKFYVGFPPAALRRTWGETEYGIGIIPLGGFCKISGMTPEEEVPDDTGDRVYYKKPVWKRNITIAAGPLMNFVAAAVILVLFVGIQGVATATLTLDEVVAGDAGGQGRPRGRGHPGRRRRRDVDRVGPGVRLLPRQPRQDHRRSPTSPRPAGPSAPCRSRWSRTRRRRERVPRRARRGHARASGAAGGGQAGRHRLQGRRRRHVHRLLVAAERQDQRDGPDGAVGPVGIIDVSRQAVQQNWYPVLLAFLSFNLGLINLLPILPFDGGHIAMNVVEKIRGRRLDTRVFERMVAVGTVLLVMLFIFLTFNDVKRLFGG